MYRVRTHNQIAPSGLQRLAGQGFEVGPEVAEPHALLLRSHRLAPADIPEGVSAVARAGADRKSVV